MCCCADVYPERGHMNVVPARGKLIILVLGSILCCEREDYKLFLLNTKLLQPVSTVGIGIDKRYRWRRSEQDKVLKLILLVEIFQ